MLTGLVFILPYTIAGLFIGMLADKYNRTKIIGIGVVVWSIFTGISGLAKNFITLAIPRAFLGVGESSITPTTMSILTDRLETKKLGFAAGIYYMGVPLGVAVSLIFAGYLGPTIGWRNSLFLIAGIGLVLGALMLFVKDTPRKVVLQGSNKQSFSETLILLFKALKNSKSLILTILAGTLYHVVLGASVFDQVWATEDKGFDRASFAQASGWIFAFFGLAGSVFGGSFSDWTLKKYNLPRTWFVLILTLVTIPFALTRYLDPSDNFYLFWSGVCVSAFSLGCFYGPMFAVIQELVPSNIRGTIVGFYLVCLNLLGYVPGSAIAGIVIEHLKDTNVHIVSHINDIDTAIPYTHTLVGFSVMFMIIGPILYFYAGKFYENDRKELIKRFG